MPSDYLIQPLRSEEEVRALAHERLKKQLADSVNLEVQKVLTLIKRESERLVK